MAKKKEEEAPAGSPAWMATFSDLMNLLLCFFVLLFSMSSVDAAKYDQVVASLQSAFSVLSSSAGASITQGNLVSSGISQLPEFANYFGTAMGKGHTEDKGKGTEGSETGESDYTEDGTSEHTEDGVTDTEQSGGANDSETQGLDISEMSADQAAEAFEQKGLNESEQMAQDIEALAAQYGLQDLVEIDFNGQFVRITLNGGLLFNSGAAELNEDVYPVVDKISKIVELYDSNIIEIEGHTDNLPAPAAYGSNDVLSMFRALNVADYIRNASSVDPANIVSSGRGAYVPIADNGTAEGRARNRRVEIKIYNSLNSESGQSNQ